MSKRWMTNWLSGWVSEWVAEWVSEWLTDTMLCPDVYISCVQCFHIITGLWPHIHLRTFFCDTFTAAWQLGDGLCGDIIIYIYICTEPSYIYTKKFSLNLQYLLKSSFVLFLCVNVLTRLYVLQSIDNHGESLAIVFLSYINGLDWVGFNMTV